MTQILLEIKQYIHELLYSRMMWLLLGKKIIAIIAIFVIGMISIRLLKILIQRIFNLRYKATMLDSTQRAIKKSKTIEKLLISIARYVVYFVVIVAILSTVGINITGLLAGAGLVSVAVGFGAQTLVKDIITGFFIALEDQFSVGDYIQIYSGSSLIAEGTVDVLGLRATKLKATTGEEWFVPNSQIIQVLNKSMNYSTVSINLTLNNTQDIANIEQKLTQYLKQLQFKTPYKALLSYKNQQVQNPRLLGIDAIASQSITLKMVAEAQPMKNEILYRLLSQDLMTFFNQQQLSITLTNNLKK